MHWEALKRLNGGAIANKLKEEFQIEADPQGTAREVLLQRYIAASDEVGSPVEGIPAPEDIGEDESEDSVSGSHVEVDEIADPKLSDEELASLDPANNADPVGLTPDGYVRRAVITVHPSANEPPFAKVSVNGRAIQITCEKKVAIPWAYFHVLENAVAGIPAVTDGTIGAGEMEFKSMRRFNYTFHGEVFTDPKTGKVMREKYPQMIDAAAGAGYDGFSQ